MITILRWLLGLFFGGKSATLEDLLMALQAEKLTLRTDPPNQLYGPGEIWLISGHCSVVYFKTVYPDREVETIHVVGLKKSGGTVITFVNGIVVEFLINIQKIPVQALSFPARSVSAQIRLAVRQAISDLAQ